MEVENLAINETFSGHSGAVIKWSNAKNEVGAKEELEVRPDIVYHQFLNDVARDRKIPDDETDSDFTAEAEAQDETDSDITVEAEADSDMTVEAETQYEADFELKFEDETQVTEDSDFAAEAEAQDETDSDFTVEAEADWDFTAETETHREAETQREAKSDLTVEAVTQVMEDMDFETEAEDQDEAVSNVAAETYDRADDHEAPTSYKNLLRDILLRDDSPKDNQVLML